MLMSTCRQLALFGPGARGEPNPDKAKHSVNVDVLVASHVPYVFSVLSNPHHAKEASMAAASSPERTETGGREGETPL